MRVFFSITPPRKAASAVKGLIAEPGANACSKASFGLTTDLTRPVCASMITIAPSRFPSADAAAVCRVASGAEIFAGFSVLFGPGRARESAKHAQTARADASTILRVDILFTGLQDFQD